MSYEKNTWQKGDVITANKLNHMEDGIAGGGGVIVHSDSDDVFDKTWKEIHDAITSGACVIVTQTEDYGAGKYETTVEYIDLFGEDPAEEYPYFVSSGGSSYYAKTENDYPAPLEP